MLLNDHFALNCFGSVLVPFASNCFCALVILILCIHFLVVYNVDKKLRILCSISLTFCKNSLLRTKKCVLKIPKNCTLHCNVISDNTVFFVLQLFGPSFSVNLFSPSLSDSIVPVALQFALLKKLSLRSQARHADQRLVELLQTKSNPAWSWTASYCRRFS